MILSPFTYVKCGVMTLVSLLMALQNFIPFYWRALTEYLYFSALTCWNLVVHSVSYVSTCFCHYMLMERYGLTHYHGLADIQGRYTSKIGQNTDPMSENHTADGHANGKSYLLGFADNECRNPAHFPISFSALTLMWTHLDKLLPSYESTLFVDFGCGSGIALLTAMLRPFKAIVGVEINALTAMCAEKNVKRFLAEHQKDVKCSNVTVNKCDMMDYRLPGEAKNATVVLFMYEPLWTMSKVQAFPIYQKVLHYMAANSGELLIVYFFAGKFTGDATHALQELNAEQVLSEKYPSLFFGANEDVMMYRVKRGR